MDARVDGFVVTVKKEMMLCKQQMHVAIQNMRLEADVSSHMQ